uniref:Uncharacterized protein n=1 Tax=mine drainage metagenome TaxID=410659 RepID=E6QMM1_9ZZZZ
MMQVRMIIFPCDDGLDVVIWGKWTQGSMRHRHFDDRTCMVNMLESLHLLSSEDAKKLENFVFIDDCPIYSSEIEEDILAMHGFVQA